MNLLDELNLSIDSSLWNPTCEYCDLSIDNNSYKWHIIKHSETVKKKMLL